MKPTRLFIALFIAVPFFLTGCAAPLFLAAAGGASYLATQKEPMQKIDTFLQDLDKSIKETTRKITGEQPTGEAADDKQLGEEIAGDKSAKEISGEQAEEIVSEKPTGKLIFKKPVGKFADVKRTKKQSGPPPQTGLVFTIQKASISPANVKKGEEVKLILQYVIMGAPASGLKVTGKSTLSADGKDLTVLKEESTTKENGTWENTLTFAVPDSATSGKYTITQELSAQELTRSSQRSFTVL